MACRESQEPPGSSDCFGGSAPAFPCAPRGAIDHREAPALPRPQKSPARRRQCASQPAPGRRYAAGASQSRPRSQGQPGTGTRRWAIPSASGAHRARHASRVVFPKSCSRRTPRGKMMAAPRCVRRSALASPRRQQRGCKSAFPACNSSAGTGRRSCLVAAWGARRRSASDARRPPKRMLHTVLYHVPWCMYAALSVTVRFDWMGLSSPSCVAQAARMWTAQRRAWATSTA